MNWQKIAIFLILWAQICLIFGVFLGQISFEKFISIQVSVIMLLVPSPIHDKRDN